MLEWPLPENCYASFGLQSTHSPLNEMARCLNVGSPRNTGRSTELSPLAALAEQETVGLHFFKLHYTIRSSFEKPHFLKLSNEDT